MEKKSLWELTLRLEPEASAKTKALPAYLPQLASYAEGCPPDAPAEESRLLQELLGLREMGEIGQKAIVAIGLSVESGSHFLFGKKQLAKQIWDSIKQSQQIPYDTACVRLLEVASAVETLASVLVTRGGCEEIEVREAQQLAELLSQAQKVRDHHKSLVIDITLQDRTATKSSKAILVELPQNMLPRQIINNQCCLFKLLVHLTHSEEEQIQSEASSTQYQALLQLLKPFLLRSTEPLRLILQGSEKTALSLSPVVSALKHWNQQRIQSGQVQAISQEITHQETLLSRLKQKHRTVLSLLSKCMGIEFGQPERRLPSGLETLGNEPRDKFRLTTQKRQQNEDLIEQLEARLCQQQQEILSIREQHNIQVKALQKQKKQLDQHLQGVYRQVEELRNPRQHLDAENHTGSLYSRPKNKPKNRNEEDPIQLHSLSFVSGHLHSRKSLKPKLERKDLSYLETLGKQASPSHSQQPTIGNWLTDIRQQQMLSEIDKLMKLLRRQRQTIRECQTSRDCQLSARLKQELKQVEAIGIRGIVLKLLGSDRQEDRYNEWLKGEKGFREWAQKRQSRVGCETVTTIREL